MLLCEIDSDLLQIILNYIYSDIYEPLCHMYRCNHISAITINIESLIKKLQEIKVLCVIFEKYDQINKLKFLFENHPLISYLNDVYFQNYDKNNVEFLSKYGYQHIPNDYIISKCLLFSKNGIKYIFKDKDVFQCKNKYLTIDFIQKHYLWECQQLFLYCYDSLSRLQYNKFINSVPNSDIKMIDLYVSDFSDFHKINYVGLKGVDINVYGPYNMFLYIKFDDYLIEMHLSGDEIVHRVHNHIHDNFIIKNLEHFLQQNKNANDTEINNAICNLRNLYSNVFFDQCHKGNEYKYDDDDALPLVESSEEEKENEI